VSGQNGGLQAVVRKRVPHTVWIHYMLHRQALPYRNMSEELQTVQELRGIPFAKLCIKHGAPITTVIHAGFLVPKLFTDHMN
jgi:hypothetical protein